MVNSLLPNPGASIHFGVKCLGHVFSVEMKSKMQVRSISISNEAQDRVLFEGDLGELEEVASLEAACSR